MGNSESSPEQGDLRLHIAGVHEHRWTDNKAFKDTGIITEVPAGQWFTSGHGALDSQDTTYRGQHPQPVKEKWSNLDKVTVRKGRSREKRKSRPDSVASSSRRRERNAGHSTRAPRPSSAPCSFVYATKSPPGQLHQEGVTHTVEVHVPHKSNDSPFKGHSETHHPNAPDDPSVKGTEQNRHDHQNAESAGTGRGQRETHGAPRGDSTEAIYSTITDVTTEKTISTTESKKENGSETNSKAVYAVPQGKPGTILAAHDLALASCSTRQSNQPGEEFVLRVELPLYSVVKSKSSALKTSSNQDYKDKIVIYPKIRHRKHKKDESTESDCPASAVSKENGDRPAAGVSNVPKDNADNEQHKAGTTSSDEVEGTTDRSVDTLFDTSVETNPDMPTESAREDSSDSPEETFGFRSITNIEMNPSIRVYDNVGGLKFTSLPDMRNRSFVPIPVSEEKVRRFCTLPIMGSSREKNLTYDNVKYYSSLDTVLETGDSGESGNLGPDRDEQSSDWSAMREQHTEGTDRDTDAAELSEPPVADDNISGVYDNAAMEELNQTRRTSWGHCNETDDSKLQKDRTHRNTHRQSRTQDGSIRKRPRPRYHRPVSDGYFAQKNFFDGSSLRYKFADCIDRRHSFGWFDNVDRIIAHGGYVDRYGFFVSLDQDEKAIIASESDKSVDVPFPPEPSIEKGSEHLERQDSLGFEVHSTELGSCQSQDLAENCHSQTPDENRLNPEPLHPLEVSQYENVIQNQTPGSHSAQETTTDGGTSAEEAEGTRSQDPEEDEGQEDLEEDDDDDTSPDEKDSHPCCACGSDLKVQRPPFSCLGEL